MQKPTSPRRIGGWMGAAILAGVFWAPAPAPGGATTARQAYAPCTVSAPAGVTAGLDRLRHAVGTTAVARDEGEVSPGPSESLRVAHTPGGYVRSIGTPAGRTWFVSDGRPGREAAGLAHDFLREHRAPFGWAKRGTTLRVRSVHETRGRTLVRFEQRHRGLRVFGGAVVVQVEPSGGISFVLADLARDAAALHVDDFSVAPDVGEASARAAALDLVVEVRGVVGAGTGPVELMIFEPSVMGLSGPSRLVWKVSVTDAAGMVAEVVLVDAHSGEVAFHYVANGDAAADDVVATSEPGLIEWGESGAIHQALSNIRGKLVDLASDDAGETPTHRWLIGEGLPMGAIRSMSDPPLYDDPDRRFSPLWWTLAEDNQGVHTNSGVAHKLAFLLSEGGTFNGQTVTGLGLARVARLFEEAQALLLPSSDYFDLDVALAQAAADLAWPARAQDSLSRARQAVEIAGGPRTRDTRNVEAGSVATPSRATEDAAARDCGPDAYPVAPGNVYYVSTAGSDSNDGRSPSSPWKSLLYAEAQATAPGSIIALKRGDVFVMSSALGIHHGGAAGAPIVWDGGAWGEGPKAVIRTGVDRSAGNLSLVNIIGASYVTFQNITVDGNHKNAFGLVVGGTDSYYSPSGYQDSETSIVIQDSEFINCGTAAHDYVIAVLFQTWNSDMSDITFRRNRVDRASNHTVAAYCGRPEHGATPSKLRGITIARNEVSNFGLNGQDRATAILLTQGVIDGVIEHNVVRQGDDGTAPALAIAGQVDEVPKNAVIRYNDVRMRDRPAMTVEGGYDPSVSVYGNLFYTEDASNRATVWMYINPNGYAGASFSFAHNTIVAGQGTAFMDDTSTAGTTTFRNNILVNRELGGSDNLCYVANKGSSVSHSHNIYYKASGGGSVVSENDIGRISVGGLTSWEPTGRGENPLLVDLPGFDWHLTASSPAIGMGDPSAGIGVDRDGSAYSSPPSVGAYARPGASSPPFGVFDTPADGAVGVTGATAVTGWALDDVEVTRVEIYRNAFGSEPTAPNGRVYIGDATFVAGARPDVAAAYPGYPLATRAGWGYMLLTNFLPTGANGTTVLYAYAFDAHGHSTLLGSKTISCSNATATKPFGTIDTPAQGQTVSGTILNFGWALTPQPASIPTDGSTIMVFLDGVPVGHPTYNQYRSDIAAAFPGYANSNGAVGYWMIDTRTLSNGIHTIAWSVTDDQGHADGIGSRFFWVQN